MRGAALVGTAGWSLPRAVQEQFPGEGTHLVRYARVLPVAEINSSFHRPHRASTYAKWAASVPGDFRFSVKLPKVITHELKLVDTAPLLDVFLGECAGLGETLGCLLVQLPPSLAFDAAVAGAFLRLMRERTALPIALEPRHGSWFGDEPAALLVEHRVARVAADPARVPAAALPGSWDGLAYWRLHGSPRTYYSSYDADYLTALAGSLRASAAVRPTWCILDNTASGAAAGNALELLQMLRRAEWSSDDRGDGHMGGHDDGH